MKPIPIPAWMWATLLTGMVAGGCANSGNPDPQTSTGLPYRPRAIAAAPIRPAAATFERTNSVGHRYLLTASDWRAAAGSWIGTPHRTGGETRQGVDCSGFVRSLYSEVAGVTIPRTTSHQWQGGKPIDLMSLRPGDLVFFSGSGSGDAIGHVGVVIGEGEFAHASTSQGVQFASHDRGYWQKRFAGARRFLP